jgi:tetratricopeptide (TPR) repeat protein
MTTAVLTAVGTLTGVIAVVVAVLQLRRMPGLSRRDAARRSRRAPVPVIAEKAPQDRNPVEGPGQGAVESGAVGEIVRRAAPQPVVLHAPTGRLAEVRGRDALLELLAELLAAPDGRFQVLAGLGGAGKTTIALALAERARAGGSTVWWVSGVDAASVTDGMLALAMTLGTPPAEVEQARAGRRHPADVVWASLEKQQGWLLVIDNADDLGALDIAGSVAADGTGWLRPTRRGLIVVTSRVAGKTAWGWHGQLHLVGCLGDRDGGQVLADLAPLAGTTDEARALSRRPGGLPLALHHAGLYLSSPFAAERSFTAYQEGLDHRLPAILGSGADSRSMVTSTWEISLDALAASGNGQARSLLRVLSCFAPSVEISPILVDHAVLARGCGGQSEAGIRAGLESLLSVGLIEARFESGGKLPGVIVHPLVADASRLYLSPAITGTAAGLLQAATGRLRPERTGDWPAWLAILPHLRSLLGLAPAVIDESSHAVIARAAAQTCFALNWSGAHFAAGELADASLRSADRLGPQHEAILSLRFQRAMSARFQGRYREAESQLREVLDTQRRVLGPDSQATLATQQELARVIANLGRYAESEAACRKVLNARLRVLGPEEQDTLITRHYLARAIGEQGRYAESETAYRELAETAQRVLGAYHPFTLMTRNYLAAQLSNQRRYAEAGTALRSLLNDWLRKLDNDYTYVLDVRYELSRAIAGQGRYAEAEAHSRSLLSDEIRVRGADHPHALLTRRELACAIDAQGNHSEAESKLRVIGETQGRILGPTHPRTLITLYCTAAAVAAQGHADEAARLYRAVYNAQVKAIGPDHPDTLITQQALSISGHSA